MVTTGEGARQVGRATQVRQREPDVAVGRDDDVIAAEVPRVGASDAGFQCPTPEAFSLVKRVAQALVVRWRVVVSVPEITRLTLEPFVVQ